LRKAWIRRASLSFFQKQAELSPRTIAPFCGVFLLHTLPWVHLSLSTVTLAGKLGPNPITTCTSNLSDAYGTPVLCGPSRTFADSLQARLQSSYCACFTHCFIFSKAASSAPRSSTPTETPQRFMESSIRRTFHNGFSHKLLSGGLTAARRLQDRLSLAASQ
jgi:hypothetical protein